MSDAVADLAPVEPPPCFHNRAGWVLYLKSAAATQNHQSNQKAIIVGEDGQPKFNERLNYCADCTQSKSLEMMALGRCDPYHLSDDPDRPDSPVTSPIDPVKAEPERRQGSTQVAPLLVDGDAFVRLAGNLLAMGCRSMEWGRA